MNTSLDFHKWFNDIAKKLENREISFRKIFKYLDSQPTPIIIVETGCLRVKDNFLDGQSTLLFDKYTLSRGEKSKVYTVDINPNSTKVCRQAVSNNVEITTDDSVHYLNSLTNNQFSYIPREKRPDMNVADVFVQIINELFQHIGHIYYIRGLFNSK